MTPLEMWRSQADRYEEIRGPSHYKREAPNLFNLYSNNKALQMWFIQQIGNSEVLCPSQDLYSLDFGYVSDLCFVFDRHENLFALSGVDQVRIFDFKDIVDMSKDQDIETVYGDAVFIFKAGKDNYGHLLIEMLPRLENVLLKYPEGLKLIVPALPEHLFDIFKLIISTLYGEKFEIYRMKTPIVRVENLIIPGPITKHNNRKSLVVHDFSDAVKKLFKDEVPNLSTKLYISRRGTKNRSMENEVEVENFFIDRGFSVIRPESMSFTEQVNAFRCAREVVGPLGAALSNIAFCESGATVTMLDPGMGDFFFYDLAALKKLNFNWLFTGPLNINDHSTLHSNWILNMNSLQSIYDSVVSTI